MAHTHISSSHAFTHSGQTKENVRPFQASGSNVSPSFGDAESNIWGGGNSKGSMVGFKFNVTTKKATQNGYSSSEVDHEELADALQENPPRAAPRPRPAQYASSTPLPPVAGTKRTADHFDSSTTGAHHAGAPHKRRPIAKYKMAGDGDNGNQYRYIPTDSNTQHSTISNGNRAPKSYAWGTSRLRRGVRDASAFASSIKSVFSFRSGDKPTATNSSLSFDNVDTQFVGKAKHVRMPKN